MIPRSRGFHLVAGLFEAGAAWLLFEAARSKQTIRIPPWGGMVGAAAAGFFALWHLRQWREMRQSTPTPTPSAPAAPGPTSPNPQSFPTPTTPVN